MAVSKEQLKEWFSKGKTPTESQFHEWIDSFRHNDDELDVDSARKQDLIVVTKNDTTIDCNDFNNKFIDVDAANFDMDVDAGELFDASYFIGNDLSLQTEWGLSYYYYNILEDPSYANLLLAFKSPHYGYWGGGNSISGDEYNKFTGFIYDGSIEISEDNKESIADSLYSISNLESIGSNIQEECQDLVWLYLKDSEKIQESSLTHSYLKAALTNLEGDWVQRYQMTPEYIPIYLKLLRFGTTDSEFEHTPLADKDKIFVPIVEKVSPICGEVLYDDDFDKVEAYGDSLFYGALYHYNYDSEEYEFSELVAQKFSDGVYGLDDYTTVWCIVYRECGATSINTTITDIILDVSEKDFNDGSEITLRTKVYDNSFIYLKTTDNAELKILTERGDTDSTWLISDVGTDDTYAIIKTNDAVFQPNAFKITFTPPIEENSDKNIVWLSHIYDSNLNFYTSYDLSSNIEIDYLFDYSNFNLL